MFNTTVNNSRTIVSNHVNAVTGQISKTYRDSFFERFSLKSKFAEKILSPNPTRTKGVGYSATDEPVQVIQMVMCGDMEVIAEIMWKTDYDKMLEESYGRQE